MRRRQGVALLRTSGCRFFLLTGRRDGLRLPAAGRPYSLLVVPGAVSAGAANINWLSVVLGVAAAAVSGYFAVRFMIKLITKHSLWGFAIYTAILGAFIVLDQNILHLIAW